VESSPGPSFWESSPPMGPPESATSQAENQARRRKRCAGRPRARLCLLKGCEQRFQPRNARQRYCSERCRSEARKWSRWKAQQQYRSTNAGKQKRNGQSQRYRQRVRCRKRAQPEAVGEPARVITKNFFRALLRPARLLPEIRSPAAKSLATLLLTGLPTCAGTCRTAGTALETGA
jgi:hypothetical protein